MVCCCCRADVAVTVGDVWRRWGLELLQTSRDPGNNPAKLGMGCLCFTLALYAVVVRQQWQRTARRSEILCSRQKSVCLKTYVTTYFLRLTTTTTTTTTTTPSKPQALVTAPRPLARGHRLLPACGLRCAVVLSKHVVAVQVTRETTSLTFTEVLLSCMHQCCEYVYTTKQQHYHRRKQ